MDYYQGYEDAMRQARVGRSTGLIGFILRMMLSIVYGAFVYIPLLIVSYFISERMSTLYSNDIFIKGGLTIVICYLLFAAVYLLKGLIIGLKLCGRNLWFVVWIVCVVGTCGVQTTLAYSLIEQFLYNRSIANYQIWSSLGAAAIAITVYSHYRFLTNVAPASVFWSYHFGFKTANSGNSTAVSNSVPIKSNSYFENAHMKVSFKK